MDKEQSSSSAEQAAYRKKYHSLRLKIVYWRKQLDSEPNKDTREAVEIQEQLTELEQQFATLTAGRRKLSRRRLNRIGSERSVASTSSTMSNNNNIPPLTPRQKKELLYEEVIRSHSRLIDANHRRATASQTFAEGQKQFAAANNNDSEQADTISRNLNEAMAKYAEIQDQAEAELTAATFDSSASSWTATTDSTHSTGASFHSPEPRKFQSYTSPTESPKTLAEIADSDDPITRFAEQLIKLYSGQFGKPANWDALQRVLATKSVGGVMQELDVVQYAADLTNLCSISLDELFEALVCDENENGFGAMAVCDNGELGAIVYPWSVTSSFDKDEWGVLVDGIGFDTNITVDDASNDGSLAIQYNPRKPSTAIAVLEWLIKFDRYRAKLSVCGPKGEVESVGCRLDFTLSTTFRRLVLEKLSLDEKQQYQLLQYAEGLVLDRSLLQNGGKQFCRALLDLQASKQLLTSRIDCAYTVPFCKDAFLELMGILTKMQGGDRSCVIVFTKDAIFDAMDKYGKSLASFLASVLAKSQGSISNRVGSDKNNLGFFCLPAQGSSPSQLRRLAHFLSEIIGEAERSLTGSKYAGKINSQIKKNRWPIEFWDPDEARTSAGEDEVELLKVFTRQCLGLGQEDVVLEYIQHGAKQGGDSDAPNVFQIHLDNFLIALRKKYKADGESKDAIRQLLVAERERNIKEALRVSWELVDNEEEDDGDAASELDSKPSATDGAAGFGFTPGGFIFSPNNKSSNGNGEATAHGGATFSCFGTGEKAASASRRDSASLFTGGSASSAEQGWEFVPPKESVSRMKAPPNTIAPPLQTTDGTVFPHAFGNAPRVAAPHKNSKLKKGDRVKVKATGEEGVMGNGPWVLIDGQNTQTRFSRAELELLDA
uniref:Uncharacterized protein n=1 Tax=Amphora coffeiformis TaxID=265554 RepID=A0A7S3P4W9_9STRA